MFVSCTVQAERAALEKAVDEKIGAEAAAALQATALYFEH
jgi:hypothetical protein